MAAVMVNALGGGQWRAREAPAGQRWGGCRCGRVRGDGDERGSGRKEGFGSWCGDGQRTHHIIFMNIREFYIHEYKCENHEYKEDGPTVYVV